MTARNVWQTGSRDIPNITKRSPLREAVYFLLSLLEGGVDITTILLTPGCSATKLCISHKGKHCHIYILPATAGPLLLLFRVTAI